MSPKRGTSAPKGRNKVAQGQQRSNAALGQESQATPSPEGAKQNLDRASAESRNSQTASRNSSLEIATTLSTSPPFFGERLPTLLDELNEALAT